MKKWILALGLLGSARAHAETTQSGLLMAGTRYQTPYFIKTGEQPGPTIVVIGGLHGDEPAGYLAARELKKWKITAGKLVLVPDSNIEAIRRKVRFYGRNMNRLFPGKKDGDAMQQVAFALWGLSRDSKPQLVLTLHESRDFHADNATRYGQTFTYDFPELTPQFSAVADQVNAKIAVKHNHFLQFVKPFPTCPTYVTWKYLHVPATSIETAKPLPPATRISYQLAALRAFFDTFGLKYSS